MKQGPSELMAAAAELDEQLRRFEELSESIQKAPMSSEKQLARASRVINEIVQVGEGLQTRLGALIAAIGHFREKQEIYAVAVQKRAQEFQERSRELEALAQTLFEQADSAGFTDVQHQADALRQQLQSIRNKLSLIRRPVPQA